MWQLESNQIVGLRQAVYRSALTLAVPVDEQDVGSGQTPPDYDNTLEMVISGRWILCQRQKQLSEHRWEMFSAVREISTAMVYEPWKPLSLREYHNLSRMLPARKRPRKKIHVSQSLSSVESIRDKLDFVGDLNAAAALALASVGVGVRSLILIR